MVVFLMLILKHRKKVGIIMLVLRMYEGKRVRLKVKGVEVWVKICEHRGSQIKIGFDAPDEVEIKREELLRK